MRKRCPKCRLEEYDGNFCRECGSKMVSNPVPECNWCGGNILEFAKFCSKCGRSREEALNTSPPLPLLSRWQKFWKAFGAYFELW